MWKQDTTKTTPFSFKLVCQTPIPSTHLNPSQAMVSSANSIHPYLLFWTCCCFLTEKVTTRIRAATTTIPTVPITAKISINGDPPLAIFSGTSSKEFNVVRIGHHRLQHKAISWREYSPSQPWRLELQPPICESGESVTELGDRVLPWLFGVCVATKHTLTLSYNQTSTRIPALRLRRENNFSNGHCTVAP